MDGRKEIVLKRPMIIWVSLFILGEIISLRLSAGSLILCLLGVLVFITGTLFFMLKEKSIEVRRIWILGSVFLLAGVMNVYRIEEDMKIFSFAFHQCIRFSGKVVEIEKKNLTTFYIVKTDWIMIDEQKYNINGKIRVEQDENNIELLQGDSVIGDGTGEEFKRATNPGGYDERSYMLGKGIYLFLTDVSIAEESRPSFSVNRILFHIRNRLQQVYYSFLSEKDGSLACAMVLGDKSGLDSEVKAMYQQNGIAHLIAISGLHIAMIGGTLYQILRKLMGGYVIPVSIGMGFILLYGMMTGLSGATCRAVIMLSMSFFAQLLGRKYDILTAVSFSLLLMLIANPYQIVQAGFLLSYGAILGIAIVNPVWKMIFPKLPKWTDGLFVSISVQIFLTPIMLYFFYEIPVYSVILNIIVVPVMSVLLFFLLMSGITGMCSHNCGYIFSVPVKIIFRFYEWICGINEQLPGTTFCMGKPDVWWIVLYYSGLFFLLVLAYHYEQYKNVIKKSFVLICGMTIIFISIVMMPLVTKGNLLVSMFDVGQGDGIYIRTPHHYNLLVDGGSSSKSSIGKYILKNGVKYYGCRKLDYVVITHSDSDHYSGIKELLENGDVRIRYIILPGIENPDASYRQLEELAKKRNCHVIYMCRGDSLTVDGVTLWCLNPEKRTYEDKNRGSLVFLLQYQEFDMLLTGDMDINVENELLNESELFYQIKGGIDVLKVSHHGSDTATSEAFLSLINPKVALISAGENNRYGHPHKETLEHLEKAGCQIFDTMTSGQILLEIKDKGMIVRQYAGK